MRVVVVVDPHEPFKASLLLQEVGSGRFSRLFFQSLMQAFMMAILLGRTGLDALNADFEPEPPDAELAQIK